MWFYRGQFCQLELPIKAPLISPAACSAGTRRHRTSRA